MATLGKNQVFEIKNGDGTSFHNLVLRKSAVESIVMSLGDKISGDVYYKDNSLSVTMHEYITYNGVNYMLVNPPTIVREGIVSDNSELKGMTKYSFVFYHPMYQLANFPFTDVAVTSDETRYLSEGKTFPWIGKPADFVAKLNKNLTGTEWIVEISSRFPQDKLDELSNVIQFDNATIADACKTFYDTWGVPYVVDKVASTEASYATGKRFKLVMGLPSNEIYENESARQLGTPYVFQMGQGVGLKNNSRTPRNNKIVTRIAGYGSEDNVPYGYPQIVWTGNQDWDYTINNDPDNPLSYPIYKGIVGGQYVKLIKHPFTRTHLMPSIFTETVNKKVNPNADGYDPTIEIKDYYDAVATQEYPYVNEINLQAPSYESHEFTDIKPELDANRSTGIVSAVPLNSDLTPADHWDDAMDDDGNYLQSYFQITLPQLSFDLYACAAITQEMQINMRSGACIGCTFPVQVDWDDYKRNFYDEEGNFVPDGEQRDLTKYPKSNLGQISVVVQKDNTTFGTLMPNIYQQPKANDLFVFIGISLPLSYIADAEERLDDAMKTYMLENNVYYFDYPLKFDEHFLATHTYILEQIRPNSIIRFDYGGIEQQLFVKQLTVKYGNAPLPQYDITLTDNVEVVLNQIGQVADDVEKLSSLIAVLRQSYNRNVWNELAKKLSKTQDDTAAGFITMLKGLQVGNQFVSGLLGEGGVFRMDADGKTYLEADKMYIRMRAYFDTVEVREYKHSAGNRVASPAGAKCVRVAWFNSSNEELEQTEENLSSVAYYRCYFRADDGEDTVRNNFVVGDQVYCHITTVNGADDNPSTKGLNQKHYWRLCIGKNTDNNLTEDGEGWVDLSNRSTESIGGENYTGYQTNSDVPEPQDSMVQLGNVNDTTRQGAIIEFVTGADAPSYQIYQGINSFSLTGRNMITLGYNSATGKAELNVYGDAFIGDPNRTTYIEYVQDDGTEAHAPKLKIKAEVEFTNSQQDLDNFVQSHQNNYDDTEVRGLIDGLQDQIDGQVESWFYNYAPVHVDEHGAPDSSVPLNIAPYSDWTTEADKIAHLGDTFTDNSTGYCWRFSRNEDTNAFEWVVIEDSALISALQKAAKAQETADNKRRVFLVQPTPPYDAGDIWVNATYPANYTGATDEANHKYNNDILKCVTAKASGSAFSINDWTLSSKYTDDTKFNGYISALLNDTGLSGDAAAAAAQRAVLSALGVGTVVSGGLLLTSLIGMRQYKNNGGDKSDINNYTTWAGISGEYNANVKGGGIAAWYGGGMVDHEVNTTATDFAKSLFRFDGSGYLAGGNITWNSQGAITIKNITTLSDSNNKNLLNELATFNSAFTFSTTGEGSTTVLSITPKQPFTELFIGTSKADANIAATHGWVNQNFVTKTFFDNIFRLYNGTTKVNVNDTIPSSNDLNIEAMFGFWTKKYISALGQGDDGSTSYSTLAALNDVNISSPAVDQVLAYNGTHWYNKTINLGSLTLAGLSDVTISSPAANQMLGYDSTTHKWVNVAVPAKYTLPTATDSVLGGVKVGTTLAIANGVLNLHTTGVNAGTYKRVTVDAYGRVTSGDNTDTDTNTWRNIYVGGTSKVGTGIDTKAINFKAGSNVAISYVAAGTGSGQSGNANYFDVVISATDTTYSAATQSAAGLMSAADKKKLDGIAEGANKYSLPLAASGTRGGVQIGFTTDAANRNYAVQLSSEKMYVNVPWENTWRGIQNNLTSQSTTDSLSAYQGYLLANGSARDNTKLPLTGGTLTGTLTARDVVVQSAYTLKIGDAILKWDSANNALKLYKLSGSSEVAVNFYATGGVSALGMSEDGSAGAGDVTWALLADGTDTRQIALSHLTTALGGYATQSWVTSNFNKYVLPTATTSALGGIKVGYTTSGKNYKVQVDASGNAFVNVPWDNTVYTLPAATTSALGGIKVGYTTFGKNYKVELDSSNNAFVNVPWENTNTTYSAGKGLRLSGTQFISDAPRVAKDSKVFGGQNTWIMEEYTHGTGYNLPSDAWYHIMSTQGSDTAYGTQLALGMTTAAAYYRVYQGGTWGDWQSIINTWRGIQNNLTSDSTTDSLSAAQGKALANGSARDNTKLPLAGGTMTGSLVIGGGSDLILQAASSSTDTGDLLFRDGSGTEIGRIWLSGNVFNVRFSDSDTAKTIIHSGNIGTQSVAYATSAGSAGSATQLATARTLWGQSFNGTANVSGDMTSVGTITFSSLGGANERNLLYLITGDNDYFRLRVGATATNGGWVEIATADDGNEPIYVRQYTGAFTNVARTLTLLDGSGNTSVPNTLSVGGALNVTGAETITGLLTANGGIAVPSSKTLKIGDAYLSYDSTNNAIRVSKNADGTGAANFYAIGGVSALGQSSDGSAGTGDVTWALLAATDTRQINLTHITTALGTLTGGETDATNKRYAVYKNSSNQLFVDVPWQAGTGTVTSVKVGSTTYTPTSGVISLPAYPAVPTKVSQLTNDSGYITSGGSCNYANSAGKLGSTNVGDAVRPIYLSGGTAAVCNRPSVGNWFSAIPVVGGDGVMEVGRYIDFHPTSASTLDHTVRLDCGTGTTMRDFTFADTAGTLLSSGNTSVTKSGETLTVTINGITQSLTNTNTTYSANNGVGLSGTTFYNSGVRATTINGNYLRVNTNGTNADLTIPYASAAYQLSTAASINSGNTATYPWRRVATTGVITTNYKDKEDVIVIRQSYNGGCFGILKIALRSDEITAGANGGVSARWIVRYGIEPSNVKVALYKVTNKIYADLYIKVDLWTRMTVAVIRGGEWTLMSSNEGNNSANPVNAYTSIESAATSIYGVAYTSIIDSEDVGLVNYANSAGKATNDSDGNTINTTYLKKSGGTMSNTNLVTNLNADLLDGVHLAGFGGTTGVMRSWGRGAYTSANQYFGNGNVVTIDPKGTGCRSANDTILSLGDLAKKNTQLLVSFSEDGLFYRRITDSLEYGDWKRFAFTSDNVASATKLETARTLWGQSFNGTANVSGDMTSVGTITFSPLGGANERNLLYLITGDNDYFRLRVGATATNGGWVEIATADDGNEPIYVRQYTGAFTNVARTLTLLDGSGNTSIPKSLSVGNNITAGSADGTYIQIGGARIVWDNTNKALKVIQSDNSTAANFYATGGVSSLGMGKDGSAGVGDVTWALLAATDTRQINLTHITTALGTLTSYTTSGKNYAVQKDSNNHLFVNVPWDNTNTTYSAGAGISLSGTTFSNSGVRSTTINGNYLRVNTNGTNADLTIPYATNADMVDNVHLDSILTSKNSIGNRTQNNHDFHSALNNGVYEVSWGGYIANHPSDWEDGSNHFGQMLHFGTDSNHGYILLDQVARSMYFKYANSGSGYGAWYKVAHSGNSSVSKSGETLSVTINGTTQSLTNTNTTYSAGNGLALNGTQFSITSNVLVQGSVIDTHVEGNRSFVLGGGNELYAFYDRGGTCDAYEVEQSATLTSQTLTRTSTSVGKLNAEVFDGLIGYNQSSVYQGEKFAVYDLALPMNYPYGASFYWSFGNGGWAAKKMRILIGKYNANGFTYIRKYTTDACPAFGQVEIGNSATGFDRLRIVVSSYTRLACFGVRFYSSTGLRTTYVNRCISTDNLYRSVHPAKDNTWNLGASNLRWAEVRAVNFYGTFNGTATKATQDSDGNTINSTYLKLSGGTLSGKLNIGSVTTSHATKLEVRTANTTADSIEWGVAIKNPYNDATNYNLGVGIRICLGSDAETTKFGGIAYVGTATYFNRGKLAFYASGAERAYLTSDNLYIGGNAVCHAGNSSVSKSGETLTVKINGTSQSLTNTWRGIQDNLTSSTNTTESLSAKQGYLLANGSARDNTKLPLAGGTMTGNISIGNSTFYASGSNGGINSLALGDDSILGDCNIGGHLGLKSLNGTEAGISFYNSSGGQVGRLTANGGDFYLYSSGSTLAHLNIASLYASGSVQIGSIKLVYDSSNNAIKVIKSDGTNANFYATGGVSALGAGSDSGGGGNYLPLSGGTINGKLTVDGSGLNMQESLVVKNDGSHNVGIAYESGTSVYWATIANPYNQNYIFYNNIADGNVAYVTTSGAIWAASFNNTSDMRKKNVVEDINLGIEQIANAPAFKYRWKDTRLDADLHAGSSAQYWKSVLPEFVSVANDEMGTLSMQYGVAALISAITVARKVMTHEEKIALLETRVSALEKENGEQEQLISTLQEELAKFKAA